MTDAPERIWTCKHGRFLLEAVDVEGEYGGEVVEYIRADKVAKLVAVVEEIAGCITLSRHCGELDYMIDDARAALSKGDEA